MEGERENVIERERNILHKYEVGKRILLFSLSLALILMPGNNGLKG